MADILDLQGTGTPAPDPGPDVSVPRGVAAGAGAGLVFGPIGLLLGAGVGLLSKRLHRGELEKAAEARQAGQQERDQLYRTLYEDFRGVQEQTAAVASEDIDQRQFRLNAERFERAAGLYLEARTPEQQQRALQAMQSLTAKAEDEGLLDIEARARAQADAEAQLERDIAKQENQSENVAEQIILREQSVARGRDYTQNKRRADELQGFEDSHTVSEDKILAQVQTTLDNDFETFYDPETGKYSLPPDLRQEIRNSIIVDVESGILSGLAGALDDALANTAQRLLDGEDLSDAELMQLLKAVNEGAIEQSQQRKAALLPVLRAQAAEIGVDPEHITSTYTTELSERQRKWRELYSLPWSDRRGRSAVRRGSGRGGGPADPAEFLGNRAPQQRRRPTNE